MQFLFSILQQYIKKSFLVRFLTPIVFIERILLSLFPLQKVFLFFKVDRKLVFSYIRDRQSHYNFFFQRKVKKKKNCHKSVFRACRTTWSSSSEISSWNLQQGVNREENGDPFFRSTYRVLSFHSGVCFTYLLASNVNKVPSVLLIQNRC